MKYRVCEVEEEEEGRIQRGVGSEEGQKDS